MLLALTSISPPEVDALHTIICTLLESDDKPDGITEEVLDTAYKFLAGARAALHESWSGLPDGNHLKDAYIDEAWKWSDEDIYDQYNSLDEDPA